MEPYYIYKNGQEVGPLNEAEILGGLTRGTFSQTDLVRQGASTWMPLSALFPAIKSTGKTESTPREQDEMNKQSTQDDLLPSTAKMSESVWVYLRANNRVKSYAIDVVQLLICGVIAVGLAYLCFHGDEGSPQAAIGATLGVFFLLVAIGCIGYCIPLGLVLFELAFDCVQTAKWGEEVLAARRVILQIRSINKDVCAWSSRFESALDTARALSAVDRHIAETHLKVIISEVGEQGHCCVDCARCMDQLEQLKARLISRPGSLPKGIILYRVTLIDEIMAEAKSVRDGINDTAHRQTQRYSEFCQTKA
jgi:hypothetical protein